jgi:hypothetical protein
MRKHCYARDSRINNTEWNFASRVVSPPKFCRIYSGKKKVERV